MTPTSESTTPAAIASAEEPLRLRPDVMSRLAFLEIFGNSNAVELELGSGDGSFLANYAALHPERNFIGVERLLGRLRKLGRKGVRAGLTNLRTLRLEAALILEWMIQPNSLDAIHVYFPDPWPKRRHWKRRLINTEFTRLAYVALGKGGRVCLRTDNAPYFEQMNEVFRAHPGFAPVESASELLAVTTDFEKDFNAKGIPTLQVTYVRLDKPVTETEKASTAGSVPPCPPEQTV